MLCSFYDPKRGNQAQQYWPQEKEQAEFSKGKIVVTHDISKHLDEDFVETKFKI